MLFKIEEVLILILLLHMPLSPSKDDYEALEEELQLLNDNYEALAEEYQRLYEEVTLLKIEFKIFLNKKNKKRTQSEAFL